MANEQNQKNHARYEPLFHFVAFPLLVLNLVHASKEAIAGTPGAAYALALAVALVLVAWYARTFALKAQDRVIRLEERVRLRELAPELAAQAGRIQPGQWVALRFASDDELPALVRRVLEGQLNTPAEIKGAIQHWRADHLRV